MKTLLQVILILSYAFFLWDNYGKLTTKGKEKADIEIGSRETGKQAFWLIVWFVQQTAHIIVFLHLAYKIVSWLGIPGGPK